MQSYFYKGNWTLINYKRITLENFISEPFKATLIDKI